jgi:hypothetical protein
MLTTIFQIYKLMILIKGSEVLVTKMVDIMKEILMLGN